MTRPGAVAYLARDGVYLNVTNRCPTACAFCLKRWPEWAFQGTGLRLPAEPDVDAAWREAKELLDSSGRSELVFCGLGEPTERLDLVLSVCAAARRESPRTRLRLNTVGLGSLRAGRDISGELAAALDEVSVSLNTADPSQWERLHRPARGLARGGFAAVCAFIRSCAAAGLRTTATAIDLPDVDLGAVEILAGTLGARFRVRPLF